jgi:hypothetical protein
VPPPPLALKSVPKGLLATVGSLLDDPLYSDVVFVLAKHGQPLKSARRIYAARKLLQRAEYFESMFSFGFSETMPEQLSITADDQSQSEASDSYTQRFSAEDSDEEDVEVESSYALASSTPSHSGGEEGTLANSSADFPMGLPDVTPFEDVAADHGNGGADVNQEQQNQSMVTLAPENENESTEHVPGPPKIAVVIKDVAYATYLAVLYYIYTDAIVFAPLSSSFTFSEKEQPVYSSTSTPTLSENPAGSVKRKSKSQPEKGAKTRKEWIAEWKRINPGRPDPCSAKAAYKLADRLDLVDLKERAFQHIIKSLTVENIAFEMFSSFSATFGDVRKVQIQYFLEHWTDIRNSEAMRNVWMQIRNGRHPGFEEVWPVIASSLEFKPRPRATAVEGDSSQQEM